MKLNLLINWKILISYSCRLDAITQVLKSRRGNQKTEPESWQERRTLFDSPAFKDGKRGCEPSDSRSHVQATRDRALISKATEDNKESKFFQF